MLSAERDEYSARAAMYRLLAAFPGPGAQFAEAVDQAMEDPHLRDIVATLVGAAFGGYIKLTGDVPAAIELISRELRAAEGLARLGQPPA